MLEGIGMTHIHLFSLDDEGAELHILKTIPFDKVEIDLFVTEYAVSCGNGLDSKVIEAKYGEFQNFFQKIGSCKEVHRSLTFFLWKNIKLTILLNSSKLLSFYKTPKFLVRNSWINPVNLRLIDTDNSSCFMSKMNMYFLTAIFLPLNTHILFLW